MTVFVFLHRMDVVDTGGIKTPVMMCVIHAESGLRDIDHFKKRRGRFARGLLWQP